MKPLARTLDEAEVAEYLQLIFGDHLDGFIQVGSDDHAGTFSRTHVPTIAAARDLILREAQRGRSVYVVPGLFRTDGRGKNEKGNAGLDRLLAVVVDLDAYGAERVQRMLGALPFLPTRVVQTSASNFQPVFLLDEGGVSDLAGANAAQRGLADLLGGDAGALGLVQPFRVPGVPNMKPSRNGFLVRVADEMPQAPSTRVTLADLDELGILARGRDSYSRVRTSGGPSAAPSTEAVRAWLAKNHDHLEGWLSNDDLAADYWRRGVDAVPPTRRDGTPRKGLQGGRASESHVDLLLGIRLARLGFPVDTDADCKALAMVLFARRLHAGAKWKASPWRTAQLVRQRIIAGEITHIFAEEDAA